MNELSARGNDHFVIFYDFMDGVRNVFYVNTIEALTSCYVEKEIKAGNSSILTENEKNIYDGFLQSLQDVADSPENPIRIYHVNTR